MHLQEEFMTNFCICCFVFFMLVLGTEHGLKVNYVPNIDFTPFSHKYYNL